LAAIDYMLNVRSVYMCNHIEKIHHVLCTVEEIYKIGQTIVALMGPIYVLLYNSVVETI